MDSGYTKQNVFISALHGLVYTHPSMAANLLCPPGSSLSPEILTSFVLPIHNQGVSLAPLQGHAPWKIFLPTTGSFFVFLITDLLPASALFPADVICYILLCSGTVHLTASYIVSFLFLCSLHVYCRSLDISQHLCRIILYAFCQHGIKDSDQFCCNCHQRLHLL